VFKKLVPSAPFDYTFVDEEYAQKFAAEERIGHLAGFGGGLACFDGAERGGLGLEPFDDLTQLPLFHQLLNLAGGFRF